MYPNFFIYAKHQLIILMNCKINIYRMKSILENLPMLHAQFLNSQKSNFHYDVK